jgi:hypothetical protein
MLGIGVTLGAELGTVDGTGTAEAEGIPEGFTLEAGGDGTLGATLGTGTPMEAPTTGVLTLGVPLGRAELVGVVDTPPGFIGVPLSASPQATRLPLSTASPKPETRQDDNQEAEGRDSARITGRA